MSVRLSGQSFPATQIAAGAVVQGQLLLANGSLAAPALAFASDPDTGLYRSAAGVTSFVGNGATSFAAGPTGLVPFIGFTGGGHFSLAVTRKTANYAAVFGDPPLIIMDGSSLVLTMPQHSSVANGLILRVLNASALTVLRINRFAGDTLNGVASDFTLAAGGIAEFRRMSGSTSPGGVASWYLTDGGPLIPV